MFTFIIDQGLILNINKITIILFNKNKQLKFIHMFAIKTAGQTVTATGTNFLAVRTSVYLY